MTYNIQSETFTGAVAKLVSQFNEQSKQSIGRFECKGVDKTGEPFKLVLTIKQRKPISKERPIP